MRDKLLQKRLKRLMALTMVSLLSFGNPVSVFAAEYEFSSLSSDQELNVGDTIKMGEYWGQYGDIYEKKADEQVILYTHDGTPQSYELEKKVKVVEIVTVSGGYIESITVEEVVEQQQGGTDSSSEDSTQQQPGNSEDSVQQDSSTQ